MPEGALRMSGGRVWSGEEGQTQMLGLLRTSEGASVTDVKVIKGL